MKASLFLNWLLRTSWQASILVVLVLVAQWLARRRLNARWQYALWLLVVVRLAMPSLPASSWSVFNAVHYTAPMTAPAPTMATPDVGLVAGTPRNPESVERGRVEPLPVVAPAVFDKQRLMRNSAIVWLAGLLLLGGRALGQNIVFVRRIRHAKTVTDEATLALFTRCKEVMRVSKQVPLAETEHVESPALYGFFHPTLLLPVNVMGQFSPAEQRHIFLHELAHVKRRDMAVHWVATVFRLLHWFNPVLWFGFQRMAADRELACDELALSCAGQEESRSYGETVLKLLEICARPAVWPGLMGILEEKSQMTRRILMIARYKQQAHWPILALLLLIGLGLVTLTDAQTKNPTPASARPDLIGEVHKPNNEPAMATVFIATAGPKNGTSPFCPSCYADCVKSAKTDAQGRFKIESLDPALVFRILVVAKDCEPKYVAKVDPARGPVKVLLEPRNYADSPPGNTLLGRVVDSQGKPIAGAAVEAHGINHKDGSGGWGSLPGVDPLAVTDEQGDFLLTSRNPFLAMDVIVESRGLARKTFTELRSGTTRHDLTMTEGAMVTGRVTWQGKPLPGVSVGMVATDRRPESFTGNFEVGTDADGRFAFINLPPNVQYQLYGIMQTLQSYGAAKSLPISTEGDGSKVDAGDLVVGPAHRVSGRVVLDDGNPIPPGTRILINREAAWDGLQIVLDQEGRFDTAGIPSGDVSLGVEVPGYRLSARNAGLDRLNPFLISGRVDKDITNLILVMEKGPRLEPNFDSPSINATSPHPLRGAEGGPRLEEIRSQSWHISGRVTDAKTGKPVASFQVTPGTSNYFNIRLEQHDRVEGSNGFYTVELSKHFAPPILKVDAAGYVPAAVTPLQADKTDLDITLQPGQGPSGTVLLPGGKPAANVTVGLLCGGQQEISINEGKLRGSWQTGNLLQITDADGHFSFAPELQMQSVAAASLDGFKLVSLSEWAANSNMILEPWGRVQGKLRRPEGPATNEDLDLAFPMGLASGGWSLNTGAHTITDEAGRFEFDRVPPGKLNLSYRVKVGQRQAFRQAVLQSITVNPGQSLELNIDAPERESPERAFGTPEPKPARNIGAAISGSVVLPDGKPAAGVEVTLIVPLEVFTLHKGRVQTQDHSLQTLTDEAGQFTLPGVKDAQAIVAAAEKGFAKIALPGVASPSLTLQPWGEIHGTLRIGRRLGANQSVLLQPEDNRDGLHYDFTEFESKTDDRGRFVFTYAPPGEQRLSRLIPRGDGFGRYGPGPPVNVKAGGITEVTVGGTGRQVVGKAVFQDPAGALDWKDVQFSMRPTLPPPSPTASNYPAWKRRFYGAETATNGAFVFEDVPPGTYDVSALAEPSTGKMANIGGQTIGAQTVTIPDAAAGQNAEPCDIGTLNLRTPHQLNVGEPATPLEAETPDGRKFRLADYRGKFVLLNILVRATPDLAQLKAAFEAYGKDDRLAMLSVSYMTADTLKEFVSTNGITWTIGTWSNPQAHLEFHDYDPFTFSPDPQKRQGSFLIDPEGKIMANSLHGAAINEAVAKALGTR
jgi:beta-lactamase regulating signal transducer with metallopeptidase domain/uncharacterized GH25 family protein/peroxiredoxin